MKEVAKTYRKGNQRNRKTFLAKKKRPPNWRGGNSEVCLDREGQTEPADEQGDVSLREGKYLLQSNFIRT